ncbi:MAG TPA: hypothetical protein VFE40_02000 [Jatrophihabitantaceae bacterium]|nr:hypothetical protein [Jatrophihabitantaceae bacterium]
MGSGIIKFGMWANGLVFSGDSPDLSVPQTNFVAQILEGDVSWRIDGRKLTIINQQRGALEYVQADDSASL